MHSGRYIQQCNIILLLDIQQYLLIADARDNVPKFCRNTN